MARHQGIRNTRKLAVPKVDIRTADLACNRLKDSLALAQIWQGAALQDDRCKWSWDDGCSGHDGVLVAGWRVLNGVMKGHWRVAVMYPAAAMINGKAFVTIIKMVIRNGGAVPHK